MTTSRLPNVMGLSEIAAYFGVSRTLAHKWTTRSGGLYPFPEPVAGPDHPRHPLSMGKLWMAEDVYAWARASGRRKGAGPLEPGLDERSVRRMAKAAKGRG